MHKFEDLNRDGISLSLNLHAVNIFTGMSYGSNFTIRILFKLSSYKDIFLCQF